LLAFESDEVVAEALDGLSDSQLEELNHDWRWCGRPDQILPDGGWLFWLVLAGRGWGKTRTGAEAVRDWANNSNERILMIAPTAADVREVMIEGPSGLLSCYPQGQRPQYNPSRHLVTFPSGAIAMTRSADEPERLRGPQFTKFWADELCSWRFAREAWDQIMFGFRLPGKSLQGVITTTPKPIPVLKEIIAEVATVVTQGSSYDNSANLSETYYRKVIKPYEGTRLGRQEINAEILDDVPGALWNREVIEAHRVRYIDIRWNLITRVVVAIDPAVSVGEDSDETGIVVAGRTVSGHVIILDDLSCRESPLGWANIALRAYRNHRADRIVGEVNNGGDLVGANIRGVDPNVPFRAVHASRGKSIRAEPVAALYEQGRVHHVGTFPLMEDQMCGFVPGSGQKSPDRMDALVWAVTELLIDQEETNYTVVLDANPPANWF
jgi:phage terminase large subunit-like protein